MGKLRLLCYVALLLALTTDSVFAEVQSASLLSEKETCARANGMTKLLQKLPDNIRDPVIELSVKHGKTIEGMLSRMGVSVSKLFTSDLTKSISSESADHSSSALVTALKASSSPEHNQLAVSFLELQAVATPGQCITLGVLATLCTLISVFAIYKFFYVSHYLRKVGDNTSEVSFEEFGEISEHIFSEETNDGKEAKTAWALPPSGFTEDERKLYQDFLMGKQVSADLVPKFEKRKGLEKRAYQTFLSDTMYIQSPKDKRFFVKVMLPALVYLAMQVMTYYAAYELGR